MAGDDDALSLPGAFQQLGQTSLGFVGADFSHAIAPDWSETSRFFGMMQGGPTRPLPSTPLESVR